MTIDLDQYAFAAGQISGAQADFTKEMNAIEISGRSRWCDALRSMRSSDLGGLVTIEMLKEFAAAAPSSYLRGYVLGLVAMCLMSDNFFRHSARTIQIEAGLNSASVCRGALLGCAFTTIVRLRGGRA